MMCISLPPVHCSASCIQQHLTTRPRPDRHNVPFSPCLSELSWRCPVSPEPPQIQYLFYLALLSTRTRLANRCRCLSRILRRLRIAINTENRTVGAEFDLISPAPDGTPTNFAADRCRSSSAAVGRWPLSSWESSPYRCGVPLRPATAAVTAGCSRHEATCGLSVFLCRRSVGGSLGSPGSDCGDCEMRCNICCIGTRATGRKTRALGR